jgi:predicted Zn-dependent peptidase
VREIFGKIPRRDLKIANPPVSQTPPTDPKRRFITLKEPGSTQILNIVYPAPDINHPDVPAIDLMNQILFEGRSSRTYAPLIQTGMARVLDGGASNRAAGGWYEIIAALEPGKSLPKLEHRPKESPQPKSSGRKLNSEPPISWEVGILPIRLNNSVTMKSSLATINLLINI